MHHHGKMIGSNFLESNQENTLADTSCDFGLAFALWFALPPLERIVIAARAWRADTFTPPSRAAGESDWSRFREEAQFYWDLSGLRIAWAQRLRD